MRRFRIDKDKVMISKTDQEHYSFPSVSQDIYLYTAAKIAGLGDEIRKFYDPENPTSAGIAAAKKHCKRDRQIAKTVVLAANYNAGPGKIHETLTMGGIDISFGQVRKIHKSYWEIFAGVKRFEAQLQDMWSDNNGYIWDALGCPAPIDPNYTKDIVNRFCQTSGHRVLQVFIYHINKLRRERGVEMHPWIIDLHDESILEVPEEQIDAAMQLLADALTATNEELKMGVVIKGEPMTANTFADIKCED